MTITSEVTVWCDGQTETGRCVCFMQTDLQAVAARAEARACGWVTQRPPFPTRDFCPIHADQARQLVTSR